MPAAALRLGLAQAVVRYGWKADIVETNAAPMKIIVQILAGGMLLSLLSCSTESDGGGENVWVTASSLGRPNVPYTPSPMITARETDPGTWVWHPERASPETIGFEQLLRQIAAVQQLRPKPLTLFSFAHRADSSELIELKSRIATAADCSSLNPCIEGTPEQLP